MSCYFVIIDAPSISNHNGEIKEITNHRALIDFILENKYIISPYRYYYLNKLKFLVTGTYNLKILYEFLKRQEYYAKNFKKLMNVNQLLNNIKSNNFDIEYLQVMENRIHNNN